MENCFNVLVIKDLTIKGLVSTLVLLLFHKVQRYHLNFMKNSKK